MTTLGLLDRVLDKTTISDVGNQCGRYGVTEIVVRFRPTEPDAVWVVLRCENRITVGRGATLPIAYDDAFTRLMHKIGAFEVLYYEAHNHVSSR